MRRLILASILIAVCCVKVLAQGNSQSVEELQGIVRKDIAERAKGMCVSEFADDPSRRDVITRGGVAIGQLCSCVETEMFAMLTGDLALRVAVFLEESARDTRKAKENAYHPNFTEFLNRYRAAVMGCGEQLRRR